MSRKKTEIEEALGPVINGLELFPFPEQPEQALSDYPEYDETTFEETEPSDQSEPDSIPVFLIIGVDEAAVWSAKIAQKCGFKIEVAAREPVSPEQFPDAQAFYELPDLENIVSVCGIEKNYLVGIFLQAIQDCELTLSQCLASDALYLGLSGDADKIEAVFSALREDGAPDTELAAIAAPMGLNIGAKTPSQMGVAIGAELLAAHTGKLKRHRPAKSKW